MLKGGGIKLGKGDGKCWVKKKKKKGGDGSILSVPRESLIKKVTFEQTPERGESWPHRNLGEECFWQRKQPVQIERGENMPELLKEQQAGQDDWRGVNKR